MHGPGRCCARGQREAPLCPSVRPSGAVLPGAGYALGVSSCPPPRARRCVSRCTHRGHPRCGTCRGVPASPPPQHLRGKSAGTVGCPGAPAGWGSHRSEGAVGVPPGIPPLGAPRGTAGAGCGRSWLGRFWEGYRSLRGGFVRAPGKVSGTPNRRPPFLTHQHCGASLPAQPLSPCLSFPHWRCWGQKPAHWHSWGGEQQLVRQQLAHLPGDPGNPLPGEQSAPRSCFCVPLPGDSRPGGVPARGRACAVRSASACAELPETS